MSQLDTIEEVWIDDEGRLHVRPTTETFPMIYRAATQVYWEEGSRSLFGPKPQERTYLDWFKQIIAAAKDEYGVSLRLADDTRWLNLSDELRDSIQTTQPS